MRESVCKWIKIDDKWIYVTTYTERTLRRSGLSFTCGSTLSEGSTLSKDGYNYTIKKLKEIKPYVKKKAEEKKAEMKQKKAEEKNEQQEEVEYVTERSIPQETALSKMLQAQVQEREDEERENEEREEEERFYCHLFGIQY